MARIANAVQCHNLLSGNKDCHEFRFSIVKTVINVSNVPSLQDCLFKIVKNCLSCQKLSKIDKDCPKLSKLSKIVKNCHHRLSSKIVIKIEVKNCHQQVFQNALW